MILYFIIWCYSVIMCGTNRQTAGFYIVSKRTIYTDCIDVIFCASASWHVTELNTHLNVQMQCAIGRNGVLLTNSHVKSPPELHWGRGHGEHSVWMGCCKAWWECRAKRSKPERVFLWTDFILAVRSLRTFCKYRNICWMCNLCMLGLHYCRCLCVCVMWK